MEIIEKPTFLHVSVIAIRGQTETPAWSECALQSCCRSL